MNSGSLVILAAGKPHKGEKPSLLTKVNGLSLFDWQLNALANFHDSPQIILGYAAGEFSHLESRAQIYINPEWKTTGSGYSLFSADLSQKDIIVSYADILYRKSIISQIKSSKSDITIVYDSHWQQRFVGRKPEDVAQSEKIISSGSSESVLRIGQDIPVEWAQGEFIGLVRFHGQALEQLRELKKQHDEPFLKALSLSDLIEWLRLQGHEVQGIDVHGDWAELNDPKDIAHFILGTKAETLDRLSKLVTKSVIQPQVSFSVKEWLSSADQLLDKIKTNFYSQQVVVRSSALSEDAFTNSNAGAYTSLLNVTLDEDLKDSIEKVILSYSECHPDDQVLVQPMVNNVLLSGVAFTRTLEHGSPFYVINYDESGDTESITSGRSRTNKTFYFRKDIDEETITDINLRLLVSAIKEVEITLNYDSLDIEFAIDQESNIYLLQTRPITVLECKLDQIEPEKIIQVQKSACHKWGQLQTPAPHILGNKALFGIMPDWNPAEIIGTNPGQLAVSLYKHLILDDVWAQQRAEYGYRDVRPQPLLHLFAGKPYIDIRASFNSFIPNNIPDELAEKLVNFYLSWLEVHPHLHDKVEFDVVPTCLGPKFDHWLIRLRENAELTEPELLLLKEGLLEITNNAIERTQDDLNKLHQMEALHDLIRNNTAIPCAEKIRLLIEYCKRYGTLTFAHLARSAFVAVTQLREAVEQGWLSAEARDGFLETVETVSHEIGIDAWATAQGEMTWETFVSTYGHLRPGTYDITSPAYHDEPERFLRPLVKQAHPPKRHTQNVEKWLSGKDHFLIQLQKNGINNSAKNIELFLSNSIKGREKAKFIFTKSLSLVLSLLSESAQDFGLDLDELSNISIFQLQSALESDFPKEEIMLRLKDIAYKNKLERNLSLGCQLPPLLCSIDDFGCFFLTEEKPNYIGSKRITERVIHLDDITETTFNIDGCIVIIPQADPGYDWLFGQNIAGLITMYGGANSHMAIRSAEFGLPAAIGVGQQLYSSLNNANTIELDPAGETIRVIN